MWDVHLSVAQAEPVALISGLKDRWFCHYQASLAGAQLVRRGKGRGAPAAKGGREVTATATAAFGMDLRGSVEKERISQTADGASRI